MTAFERLKLLCDERGISVNTLEEKIGLGKNTLYSWNKNTPKGNNLVKVADYFNESVDYLLGRADRKEAQKPYYALTEKDDRDIAKDLERIMSNLDSNHALAFYGEETEYDEDAKEMLRIQLEQTMRMAKQMAKKKFTPKKYRNE
ncbi:MAG TPA: helix-turn-helix domain-containing protein [Candidatus Paenibacillus intestinavium]|nr:helix-turn-helix domain-containing protein [Candidatus Paenibacillus intestinavium]